MSAAAATSSSLYAPLKQISSAPIRSLVPGGCFWGSPLRRNRRNNTKPEKITSKVIAAAIATAPPVEEIQEYKLPTWAEFELGRAPVYWKTMNGLHPTSGERLKLFYNPAATKLVPNEDFGIAFNGGFNQAIMCGGQPRAMLQKVRGIADPPIYTIQICIPKHVSSSKAWRNKPASFFAEGLAGELSKEGACEGAIFPDTEIVVDRCTIMGNLTLEGGDRCSLDLVPGCTDPSSPMFNPLATFDDGSCPLYSDSDD